jgi:TonB-dependent SusC/RagA subfamily outer membrane receptor
MTLIIMGLSNSRTSGEPLYVIDGIPQPGGSGRIGLNPRDIARIEVLKEGGAMAMYGFRGANGVIVIETKKGNERGGSDDG